MKIAGILLYDDIFIKTTWLCGGLFLEIQSFKLNYKRGKQLFPQGLRARGISFLKEARHIGTMLYGGIETDLVLGRLIIDQQCYIMVHQIWRG